MNTNISKMIMNAVFACIIGGLAFTVGTAPSVAADTPAIKSGPPLNPEVPFLADWISSPHADWKSEAFIHWDKDGVVPEACARCHSGTGFIDFMGADGSTPGKVDHPAAIGSVITCVTCHNEATLDLSSVTFPSGLTVKKQGKSARCMQCHQGRESTFSVEKSIKGMDDDTVSKKIKFRNVHYRAAGATLMGTLAKGGYEYSGLNYAGSIKHKEGVNECTECHNPHRAEVRVALCTSCHKEVIARKDLITIRDGDSKTDFDGDGNIFEGIGGEVGGLHSLLYKAIQAYAKTIAKKPIGYDAHAYPYFFNDSNGNGVIDKEEANRKNSFKGWTPRLLRAAYNYQFVAKDPGAYAHNGPYTIQLLVDSLNDLAKKVPGVNKAVVRAK